MRYLILGVILCLPILESAYGETYIVRPDGSGDFPTIQAAIDAADDGDIIELTDGTFAGDGNRDIQGVGLAITVRSQMGNPEACVIDCGGSETEHHRGFYLYPESGSELVLEGVTIENGYATHGGGVVFSGTVLIANCIFLGNTAAELGGGVEACGGEGTLINCAFVGNSALDGGGVQCDAGMTVLDGCTFSGNWASFGGGLSCRGDAVVTNCTFYGNTGHECAGGIICSALSSPQVENTIIAFSIEGEAVYCHAGCVASLSCCNVYGNPGGDWCGCIEDQYGVNGNIWEDPQFCDPENGDFSIAGSSPCAPDNAPTCGLIGAGSIGCDAPPATLKTSWGEIKAVFSKGD
ncbi:MAG: hypothetical protein KAY24_11815 [Candidatus Eisenbacteria sp.]|nr:hypothetical protein [Candidatus Eisenbacteria bacterium]